MIAIVSSHMARAWIAIFLAPTLVAAALFGVPALLLALPVMLAITIVVAVPLFLLLKRRRHLTWWHAFLSGAFCGLCFPVLDWLLGGYVWPDPVTSRNVFYVGLGALIGTLFWWMGVFRNPSFPFVDRRFPASFLLIVPIAVGGVLLHKALRTTSHQGRVLTLLEKPTEKSRQGLAAVRLLDGSIVQAQFGDTWPPSTIDGKCFHLIEHWSTARFRRVYSLQVPYGGEVDDC